MDWNDLRYFLAVARAGTLVGAAKELGVEHTTVSRRLAALEGALGAKLFTRSPGGFTLTPVGVELLPSVESMATLADSVARRASGEDARVAGTVRLTIPESANGYLVQQLAALRERHPELVVELLSGNRAFDLRRGEADLAIRILDVTDPDLVVRRLGSAGWSLYAAASYVARKGPLAPEGDLRGHDVIGFDTSLADVPGARWIQEHHGGANVVLRGNSIGAIVSAVTVGLGIAPLPCFVGGADPSLRRLTTEVIGARDILLAVHPDLTRAARVRAAMAYLLEIFARDADLWSGVIR